MEANITRWMLLLLLVSLPFCYSYSQLPKGHAVKPRPEKWFAHTTCSSLTINDYAHAVDKVPARSKTLTDTAIIHDLMSKIAALPPDGEMMISFAPIVPLITLTFTCESGNEKVEFYGSRIKTPGTSFYMSDTNGDREVFARVQELLAQ